jgi:hypothetical protein
MTEECLHAILEKQYGMLVAKVTKQIQDAKKKAEEQAAKSKDGHDATGSNPADIFHDTIQTIIGSELRRQVNPEALVGQEMEIEADGAPPKPPPGGYVGIYDPKNAPPHGATHGGSKKDGKK